MGDKHKQFGRRAIHPYIPQRTIHAELRILVCKFVRAIGKAHDGSPDALAPEELVELCVNADVLGLHCLSCASRGVRTCWTNEQGDVTEANCTDVLTVNATKCGAQTAAAKKHSINRASCVHVGDLSAQYRCSAADRGTGNGMPPPPPKLPKTDSRQGQTCEWPQWRGEPAS